jgi:hypothetical protein
MQIFVTIKITICSYLALLSRLMAALMDGMVPTLLVDTRFPVLSVDTLSLLLFLVDIQTVRFSYT